jgi:hypothetical protein
MGMSRSIIGAVLLPTVPHLPPWQSKGGDEFDHVTENTELRLPSTGIIIVVVASILASFKPVSIPGRPVPSRRFALNPT